MHLRAHSIYVFDLCAVNIMRNARLQQSARGLSFGVRGAASRLEFVGELHLSPCGTGQEWRWHCNRDPLHSNGLGEPTADPLFAHVDLNWAVVGTAEDTGVAGGVE